MNEYNQAVDKLVQAIQNHDSVRDFQEIEQKMKRLPELENTVNTMKAYQQDAVLYHKIDKPTAEKTAVHQAEKLEKEVSNLPIVKDYREKMQDASDLIQYITKSLEEKINKGLSNGKR